MSLPEFGVWQPNDVTNFLLALAAIGCGILSNMRQIKIGKAIIELNKTNGGSNNAPS